MSCGLCCDEIERETNKSQDEIKHFRFAEKRRNRNGAHFRYVSGKRIRRETR